MTIFNYALETKDYTIKNALLWGNFYSHCKKAGTGKLGGRIVHVLIAAAQFIPIISQIASLFEMLIVKLFGKTSAGPVDLKSKKVTSTSTPSDPKPTTSTPPVPTALVTAPKPYVPAEVVSRETFAPLAGPSKTDKPNLMWNVCYGDGKEWFEFQHMYNYFLVMEDKFKDFSPQIRFQVEPRSVAGSLKNDLEHAVKGKIRYLAYPFFINSNHWTLLLIDRERRTCEYYDSRNGETPHELKEIHLLLNKLDPKTGSDKDYEFINKITTSVQSDTFQCGPWVCYFLKNRLENPDINFNTIHPKEGSEIIAKFRKEILEAIAERRISEGAVNQIRFEDNERPKQLWEEEGLGYDPAPELSCLVYGLFERICKRLEKMRKETKEEHRKAFDKMIKTIQKGKTFRDSEIRRMLTVIMAKIVDANEKTIDFLTGLVDKSYECPDVQYNYLFVSNALWNEPPESEPEKRLQHYIDAFTYDSFSDLQAPLEFDFVIDLKIPLEEMEKKWGKVIHFNVVNAVRWLFMADLNKDTNLKGSAHLLITKNDLEAAKNDENLGFWMGWLRNNNVINGEDCSYLWYLFLQIYTEEDLVSKVLKRINAEGNDKLRLYYIEELMKDEPEDRHGALFAKYLIDPSQDYFTDDAVREILKDRIEFIRSLNEKYSAENVAALL